MSSSVMDGNSPIEDSASTTRAPATGWPRRRLLDRLRETIRARLLSWRTESRRSHGRCTCSDGSGLRLLKVLRLRAKGLYLDRLELPVRKGGGKKDRLSVVPERLRALLLRQLERTRELRRSDLARELGEVGLPSALVCKYPHAGRMEVHVPVRLCVDQPAN